MKIIQCDQGTPLWFEARRGIPSSSNFDKIITTKGQPSKQAEKYMYKLAGERLSGRVEDSYTNQFMERGKEMEAEAREFYEFTTGNNVEQAGFCVSDDGKFGCSPDGLVGEDGGLEIKNPIMSTHIGYLLKGGMPSDYYQQVQGSLFVSGRKWWDFLSYYPGIKPLLIRVTPDKTFLKSLEIELRVFSQQLEDIVKKLS